MSKVIINQFDGGRAQSDRDTTTNENIDCSGFDILLDENTLVPYTGNSIDHLSSGSGTSSTYVIDAVLTTTGQIIGVAYLTTSGFRFVRKDSLNPRSFWVVNSASDAGNTARWAIAYKGGAYGLADERLYRYDSDTAHTLIGTISGSGTGTIVKPIVHSQDNVMYMASGKILSKYDGTTFTASAFTMPYDVIALEEYGQYLAVFCQGPDGKSVVYLWGRDTSLSTLQQVIEVGEGLGKILVNLEGVLYAISEKTGKVIIRGYLGGVFTKLKQIEVRQLSGSTYFGTLYDKRIKSGGNVFFTTGGQNIICFGKNKKGQYIVTRDRNMAITAGISSIHGLFAVESTYGNSQETVFFYTYTAGSEAGVNYFTNTALYAASPSASNYGTAVYTTTLNPSMPIEDRNKEKQLQKVWIKIAPMHLSFGSITVEYSVNGSSFVTVISQNSTFTNNIMIFEASAENTGASFLNGSEYKFKITSTSGVSITEFGYSYDNINTLH